MELNQAEKEVLLATARYALLNGVRNGVPPEMASGNFSKLLLKKGAAFVTLRNHGKLRGCMGTLYAHESLVKNVLHNAYNAAFKDNRFAPLTADELKVIDLHISVLTKPQPLLVDSEVELQAKLVPGTDGVILRYRQSQATFLPAVWESIAQPAEFIRQLKLKAGWSADFWSSEIKIELYRVIEFTERSAE